MTLPIRYFPILIIGLSAAAYGDKPKNIATQTAVTRVMECRDVATDAARLACYDQAVTALNYAVTHKEITVLDKEDVRRTKRTLYGFSLPNLQLFGIGEKTDSPRAEDMTLDTTLRSVRQVSYGKWDMETAEQAVWRNVDLIDVAPTVGEKVHIKPGALGSFFFKVGSDRAVKAVRIK